MPTVKNFSPWALIWLRFLYCGLLYYIILLRVFRNRLIVIVNIDIVIPGPSDQPNPDIQMVGFGIKVELCRLAGRLRVPAEPPHGVQRLEGRQLEQGVLELVDLLRQLRRCRFPRPIVPGCPPPIAVIIRAGVNDLADRLAGELHRRCIGVLEYFLKGAGGFQIADTLFCGYRESAALHCIPFCEGQGSMGGIPKGLIYTTGFTDLHIRIAAECIDHQVGCQRGAAPQALGRLCGVAVRVQLFVLAPGRF